MPRTTKAMLEAALAQAEHDLSKMTTAHAQERVARGVAEKERHHLHWRLLNVHAGVMLLAERAGASVAELGQLGLARIVMEERDGKQVPTAVAIDLTDLLYMADDAMKRQATVAQFRQLKGHFVTHQRAVTHLLDQLNGLAGKNVLSGADMQRLRDVRRDLSSMIKREI